MLYVVSYDIVEDRSRTRLLRDLRGLGVRVQYSVVECAARTAAPGVLEGLARAAIQDETDSVRVYPICSRCRQGIVVVGSGEVTRVRDCYTR